MQVMDDLRSADVDFLTIGQYLQPTRKHAAVDRFVTPGRVRGLRRHGARQGLPDGLGHAADPLLLPRRRATSRALASARCARGAAGWPPPDADPRRAARSCPTRRSSSSTWWPMSRAIRNSCPGASARGSARRKETELVADLTIGFRHVPRDASPAASRWTGRTASMSRYDRRPVPLPEQPLALRRRTRRRLPRSISSSISNSAPACCRRSSAPCSTRRCGGWSAPSSAGPCSSMAGPRRHRPARRPRPQA